MDKYKSDQTVYDPKKKKFVPLWRLDIHTITVTHFILYKIQEKILAQKVFRPVP